MRVPSGTTTQYLYFVAVDATDKSSRETGLSSFAVYRSRNGASPVAMSTPTVVELSSSNMPGVYALLLDEDMVISNGVDDEEMAFHITHAGMEPVTRSVELYRPKIAVGSTIDHSHFGIHAVGTLTGTHSATTADLGANAPSTDVSGMTLYIPSRGFVRVIDSYDTGTGVATFETTSATLTDADAWILFTTPKASAASPIPANIKQVNDIAVDGAGTSGDPWGPA